MPVTRPIAPVSSRLSSRSIRFTPQAPQETREEFSAVLFVLLLLHICGCEAVLDYPVAGSDDQSIDFIATHNLLHPINATFTLAFGSRPAPLHSISVSIGEIGFLPDRILESVYLIYPGESTHGTMASQPAIGAAFILRVSDLSSSRRPILFLVTARHVVDPRWARCAVQNPGSIMLRLNREIGGVGYEAVSLQNDSAPSFITSSDTTVDLALIPITAGVIPNPGDYKILEISYDDVLTSSDLPLLRQGLPISTTGLPTSVGEVPVDYPIRITGSILQMRDEEAEVPCSIRDAGTQRTEEPQDQGRHNLRHVWFINSDVSAGLSGAPVFVDLERGPGIRKARMLLGIQSAIRPENGLMGITPAFLLGDLVRSAVRREQSAEQFLQGSVKLGNWSSHNKRRRAGTPFE